MRRSTNRLGAVVTTCLLKVLYECRLVTKKTSDYIIRERMISYFGNDFVTLNPVALTKQNTTNWKNRTYSRCDSTIAKLDFISFRHAMHKPLSLLTTLSRSYSGRSVSARPHGRPGSHGLGQHWPLGNV